MRARIVQGAAVESLLGKAAQRATDYKRVIVFTAFLDQLGVRILERVVQRAQLDGASVFICLGPSAYASATQSIRAQSQCVRGLHSKVYALEGRRPEDDDLMVTSANLTESGLRKNLETGIRLQGAAPELRPMLRRVSSLMGTRSVPKARSSKKQVRCGTTTNLTKSQSGVTQ